MTRINGSHFVSLQMMNMAIFSSLTEKSRSLRHLKSKSHPEIWTWQGAWIPNKVKQLTEVLCWPFKNFKTMCCEQDKSALIKILKLVWSISTSGIMCSEMLQTPKRYPKPAVTKIQQLMTTYFQLMTIYQPSKTTTATSWSHLLSFKPMSGKMVRQFG